MTLQYRIRSQHEDDKWRQKIQLCYALILQVTDEWCRSDYDYPTQNVVACVFSIFSPETKPDDLAKHELFEYLLNLVGDPTSEYAKVWPQREPTFSQELIHALTTILDDATLSWADSGLQNPTIESVVQLIVNEVVHQQFVIFHHWESTCRDNNHWGIG